MGVYRPASGDPFADMARAQRRESRRRREANTPTRTQTYQAVSKIGSIDKAVADAKDAAERAEAASAEAALAAQTASETAARAERAAADATAVGEAAQKAASEAKEAADGASAAASAAKAAADGAAQAASDALAAATAAAAASPSFRSAHASGEAAAGGWAVAASAELPAVPGKAVCEVSAYAVLRSSAPFSARVSVGGEVAAAVEGAACGDAATFPGSSRAASYAASVSALAFDERGGAVAVSVEASGGVAVSAELYARGVYHGKEQE